MRLNYERMATNCDLRAAKARKASEVAPEPFKTIFRRDAEAAEKLAVRFRAKISSQKD